MGPDEALAWLRQVARDRHLPESAWRTALSVTDHLQEGRARPGVERIVSDTELNRATVIRHINALAGAGHLRVEPGGGRGHPTTYIPLLYIKTVAAKGRSATVSMTEQSQLDATEAAKRVAAGDTVSSPKQFQLGATVSVDKPVDNWGDYRGANLDSESDLSSLRCGLPDGSEFVQDQVEQEWKLFYERYPRKQGKRRAWLAWKNLSKKDRKAAMAGLETYRFSEDKNFIPHPATWINGRRWEDEDPEPPPPSARAGTDLTVGDISSWAEQIAKGRQE